MPECQSCDRSIPSESNFCPSCGAPQNETAAEALQQFTRARLAEMSPAEREELLEDESVHGGSTQLERRVSYALGWVTIVAGLLAIPHVATLFVVLAGILVLPPIRRLVVRRSGLPLRFGVFLGVYGVFVLLGGIFLFLF